MALPAIAGAFTKGLLGAGARGAATGGAKAMAGQAAKGAAKQGFKKFAQGMTGRTSDDYKARVDGINPTYIVTITRISSNTFYETIINCL